MINKKEIREMKHYLCLFKAGFYCITKQKFRNALKRSIGANKDYADGCWIAFQNSPMFYVLSRTDKAQTNELIKLCVKLGIELLNK